MFTEEKPVTLQTTKNNQLPPTHWRTSSNHPHTKEQPVTIHTLENNQLPSTHWGTSRYHAHKEEQAVTMHPLKNKQLPFTHWRTNSNHAHAEEYAVILLKNLWASGASVSTRTSEKRVHWFHTHFLNLRWQLDSSHHQQPFLKLC